MSSKLREDFREFVQHLERKVEEGKSSPAQFPSDTMAIYLLSLILERLESIDEKLNKEEEA